MYAYKPWLKLVVVGGRGGGVQKHFKIKTSDNIKYLQNGVKIVNRL